MRIFITVLGTICILPFTAFALECIQCFEKDSDYCDGPSVVCKNAKECMVISELYHIDPDTYHTIKKDCNEMYPCGKTLYVTNQYEAGMKVHIDCCEGDNCNTFNYNMPPENIELKGDYCSSCFENGLSECKGKRMIQCEEKNYQCYNYIGKLKNPAGKILDVSIKGCLSPEGCALGYKSFVGVTELVSVSIVCTAPDKNI